MVTRQGGSVLLPSDFAKSELLYSRVVGRPGRTAVLFLHGFMGSSEDWSHVVAELSHDYYCVMLDLPGHGESTAMRPDAYSIEGSCASILRTLVELELQRPVLVGYSMGGRIALHLALKYPEFFSGIVLESASPGLASRAEREERQHADEALANQLCKGSFAEFLKHWYSMPLFHSLKSRNEVFAQVLERRTKNIPTELARSLRGSGTGVQQELWSMLHTLTLPTCILTGERDAKFCGIAHRMCASSSQVRHYELQAVGHNVHLEAPREYAERLREFIAGVATELPSTT